MIKYNYKKMLFKNFNNLKKKKIYLNVIKAMKMNSKINLPIYINKKI